MQTELTTKKTVYCALLIALSVFLGGALKIPAFVLGTYSMKISFGALPVILAGILFGPVYGGMAGGIADVMQANLFPVGAYQPWFTLSGILFGLIPGLFFMANKKPTFPRIFMAVGCGQIISSVILNTLLISYLYSLPVWGILPARLLNQTIMIPVYSLLLRTVLNLPQFRNMNEW